MDVVKGWLFAAPGGSQARSRVMAILFGNTLYWFDYVSCSIGRFRNASDAGVPVILP